MFPQVTSSPVKNKNVLSRLYYEKTVLRPDMVRERKLLKGDRCFLFRDPSILEVLNFDIFIVGPRTYGHVLLASTYYFGGFPKKGWISEEVGLSEVW